MPGSLRPCSDELFISTRALPHSVDEHTHSAVERGIAHDIVAGVEDPHTLSIVDSAVVVVRENALLSLEAAGEARAIVSDHVRVAHRVPIDALVLGRIVLSNHQ